MLTDQDLDLGNDFSAWTTAIMTIGAMNSGLKRSCFPGIKQSLVKSAQITFGLVQILNVWVHAQWKLDH